MDSPISLELPVPWTVGDIARGLVLVMGLTLLLLISLFLLLPLLGILPRGAAELGLLGSLGAEGIMLFAAWLFGVRKYGLGWEALAFRPFSLPASLGFMVVILLLGFALNAAYFKLVDWVGWGGLLPPPIPRALLESRSRLVTGGLLATLVAPFGEEAFFRGFVFAGISGRYGRIWGAVVSAGLFALAHLQPSTYIPVFALGLLLAWLYVRTSSLWPAIIVHSGYNGLVLLLAAQ